MILVERCLGKSNKQFNDEVLISGMPIPEPLKHNKALEFLGNALRMAAESASPPARC